MNRRTVLFIVFLLSAFFVVPAVAGPHDFRPVHLKLIEDDGFATNYYHYQPLAPYAIDRTVIILPTLMGTSHLEHSWARILRKEGANVFILSDWTGKGEYREELEIFQVNIQRALRAYRSLKKRIPQGHKLSLLGTSEGGLYASILASIDDQPDRVMVITAGATVPVVLAHSDAKVMNRYRSAFKQKLGIETPEELAEAISEHFDYDLFRLRQGFKNKRLGMVIATEDTTVPTFTQENLRDLWTPEFLIKMNGGHVEVIVSNWLRNSHKIRRFLID